MLLRNTGKIRILGAVRLALGLAALLSPLAFAGAGCGARSPLRLSSDTDAAVVIACVTDADCPNSDRCAPQHCVEDRCTPLPPVVCNDNDDCTEDTCDPATGSCSFRALSRDEDEDGHKGPRPGFVAGEPGACGDDCDDTSPAAFPGGRELCDGVDNDCNGIVDDGSGYGPTGDRPILISTGGFGQASRGGISHTGERYGVTFAGERQNWGNYFKGLLDDGSTAIKETSITNVRGTAFSGPLLWTGSMFGTAWPDRREGDSYDVWFNRLDANGKKLGPDLRVSDAPGFSLDPSLVWNGSEFLMVWSDNRDGSYRVYGQRIGADGQLLSGPVGLTGLTTDAEAPTLAKGQKSLGLAFTLTTGVTHEVGAMVLGPALQDSGRVITLGTDNAVAPVAVFSRDRYVVVWQKQAGVPGDAIWGATLSETGDVLQTERRLTSGSAFARAPTVLPLGDRVLLVWSQYQSGRYLLFTKMLSSTLEELAPETPIPTGSGDSLYASGAFGPNGDIGLIFVDNQGGDWQVYFSRLVCGSASPSK